MDSRSVGPALGRRFVLAALLVAVLPLGAIALWATHGAGRSGRVLLRTQLESQLEVVQRDVERRWEAYRSELVMLGENEPVRVALLAETTEPGEPPDFLRSAFRQTTAFERVTIRDRAGIVRWALEAPRASYDGPGSDLMRGLPRDLPNTVGFPRPASPAAPAPGESRMLALPLFGLHHRSPRWCALPEVALTRWSRAPA